MLPTWFVTSLYCVLRLRETAVFIILLCQAVGIIKKEKSNFLVHATPRTKSNKVYV